MSGPYLIFITFMALALLLLVAAWARTLVFFRHQSPEGALGFDLVEGAKLWLKLLRRNGFGPDAEPLRRRVIRLYVLAIAVFAFAVVLFTVLPAVPG
ncbi:hypothetical protein [Roseibium aggregatum]|uniref:Uncharacterized protein n=1 Tax=Roseibium aggregatum TaxID=187304 RepID=A0A926NVH8_9HYPH|nr:hypothetical protein [Roseibium aggregatum]MBD1547174.1 hypothetical protein [Roseibium aggregatum]